MHMSTKDSQRERTLQPCDIEKMALFNAHVQSIYESLLSTLFLYLILREQVIPANKNFLHIFVNRIWFPFTIEKESVIYE